MDLLFRLLCDHSWTAAALLKLPPSIGATPLANKRHVIDWKGAPSWGSAQTGSDRTLIGLVSHDDVLNIRWSGESHASLPANNYTLAVIPDNHRPLVGQNCSLAGGYDGGDGGEADGALGL